MIRLSMTGVLFYKFRFPGSATKHSFGAGISSNPTAIAAPVPSEDSVQTDSTR